MSDLLRMDSEVRSDLDRIEDALKILASVDYVRLFGHQMTVAEIDLASLAAQTTECYETLRSHQ